MLIINRISGDIIRITDVFNIFKEKKRSDITPIGFIVGNKKIYLTTNNGRLLIIDIKTGKTIRMVKIDGNQISKPIIENKKLHIIKDNMIVRFD